MAHDVNNLLGVMGNNPHLIGRHAVAAELRAPLQAILRGAQAGSEPTWHPLRFVPAQDQLAP